jgi:hypothetical protein
MRTNKLINITNKLRKYTKYEPPQPRNKMLPPTYAIFLSASPKGGGKSYNCIQLLTNYENSGFISEKGEDVRMRTIWISGGTSRSKQNSILDSLTTLHDDDRIDVEENVDKRIKEVYEEIKLERDMIEAYNVYREVYDKFEKSKDLSDLEMDELMLLNFKNFIDPEIDPDAPTDQDGNLLYHPRMVFMIIDDLIGSDAFSNNKRGNFLNRLAIKSRHESEDLVGLNLFFITQSFKSVPSIVRRQSDVFILLKSASRSYIIDAISEEVGSHFSKEEISEYYDQIMKVPYGSLILNIHKKENENHRVRQGWDTIIKREEKYLNN